MTRRHLVVTEFREVLGVGGVQHPEAVAPVGEVDSWLARHEVVLHLDVVDVIEVRPSFALLGVARGVHWLTGSSWPLARSIS